MFQADSALYAIPAALGAAATVIAADNNVLSAGSALAIVAVVVALRLLALRHGWRAPGPRRR